MNDMRVGGRKIILCGVAFTKPIAMESIARDVAQRLFQAKQVKCVQVGGNTPCDGRASARFGEAIVVQCKGEDGRDIAAELADRGLLCDVPAQSGGVYPAC